MNVRPGDFAEVINSVHGNNGRQCYILHAPGYLDDIAGWCWAAVLLQPSYGRGPKVKHPWGKVSLLRAGEKVWARDCKLRRIDPPEDSEEVVKEIEKELT